MAAYKPKKTKLIHESWKKASLPVLQSGGWTGKKFVPVSSYAKFRKE